MSNHSNSENKVLTVVLIVAAMIGLFLLQKAIPKLPFEPPTFYCRRTTDFPFVSTTKEYDECMRKNTGPSDEVMQYVKKNYGSELNDKQELCMGETIERYLSGEKLRKFLNGTPAIDLIGQNKAIDLTADILKCIKK